MQIASIICSEMLFSAGIRGQGFDLERILDLLCYSEEKRIAVERGAIEAIEAYLVTLDLLIEQFTITIQCELPLGCFSAYLKGQWHCTERATDGYLAKIQSAH